jgi:hypothetical protein
VSPVKYELGFYIPDDGILHSHRRENLKSYSVKPYAVRLHIPKRAISEYRPTFLLLHQPATWALQRADYSEQRANVF